MCMHSRAPPHPPSVTTSHPTQKVYGSGTIVIHQRPGKLGLGTAYVDGLKLARAPFVVLMDADLSHHPKFIPEMYRCVSVHFHSFRVDCSLLAWVAEAWGGPADWC